MARESRDVWAKRVERWRDSGLSAREFAAEIGVNPRTLQHWGWKLSGRSGRGRTKTRPGREFRAGGRPAARVPVVEVIGTQTAAAPSAEPVRYDVELANGVTVRVPASFDDASLGRLLSVLEAR